MCELRWKPTLKVPKDFVETFKTLFGAKVDYLVAEKTRKYLTLTNSDLKMNEILSPISRELFACSKAISDERRRSSSYHNPSCSPSPLFKYLY